MKRYKKWMAALLTGILVVTGTMSPALAAELPTEAEELVSAAELSDELVTNAAAIPDVSEIEEDEVAADIPEDDAAIPTAPDLTAEQPDEADTVSSTPAFPVKSMTLSNDTFLYFVSDDPSFRRSYWDENDDYLNDSVQLILRTTLAAKEFDDVWITYTETNPTGDYAHTINFVLDEQQKDKNGLWILTLRLYSDTNREVSGSDGCFELRGGTYYLQVANNSEQQTSVGYLLNDLVATVSEVKLGLTTFASQQAVPLTVNFHKGVYDGTNR